MKEPKSYPSGLKSKDAVPFPSLGKVSKRRQQATGKEHSGPKEIPMNETRHLEDG